jgi:penicillin-binding protein 2
MVIREGRIDLFEDYKDHFVKAVKSRVFVLIAFFIILAILLIQHLFKLQIIHGEEYLQNFSNNLEKSRTLAGTRGTIYDINGVKLAWDEPSNNISMEDNGVYQSETERNLALNSISYRLIHMLEEKGETLAPDFNIILDDNDNYVFKNTNAIVLLRFKADIYGKKTVEELSDKEETATPNEIIDFLSGSKKFQLVSEKNTAEVLAKYELPEKYEKQELLDIIRIRYAISNNSYQKYMATIIATDVSTETVALITENKAYLQGVYISEQSKRVYNEEYNISLSNILGYTGKISSEELESFQEQDTDNSIKYNTNDIVGKVGIENTLDSVLQGKKGSETFYVDSVGTELAVTSSEKPQIGKNVQLSIDAEFNNAVYKMIEQSIANILKSKIIDAKTFTKDENADQSTIKIPIDDVYFALLDNNIVDINHFKEDDASQLEQEVYGKFQSKLDSVTEKISNDLKNGEDIPYKDLPKETKVYYTYIIDNILMSENVNILAGDLEKLNDETYQAYRDPNEETIGLREFLTYAISMNWIDSSKIQSDAKYSGTDQIYDALIDFITEYIQNDKGFHKKVYKYMIFENSLSGKEICTLLYDQGVLDKEKDAANYNGLVNGTLGAYSFMLTKIEKLEITPAQLALKPSTGSVVLVNPNTGKVIVNVSYPGYDNNKLANNMDDEYYQKISQDKSGPLYNKATQQLTAPGSTFKPVTAVAGYNEGAIGLHDTVVCNGVFDALDRPLRCWSWATGGHGSQDMLHGIGNSCNVYFAEVAYRLEGEEGNKSDDAGLKVLAKYASDLGLDSQSGIEIEENLPKVSSNDAVRSAIGQGKHLFTTTQLAKYAATLANKGTVYDLSLIQQITDSGDNVIEEYKPKLVNQLEYSSELWDTLHSGMDIVTRENDATKDLRTNYGFSLLGKTGTAEEIETNPNHALFIGFAPAVNPEYAIAVRIANGYSSKNAADLASNIMKYRYDLVDKSELITGKAKGLDAKLTDRITD